MNNPLSNKELTKEYPTYSVFIIQTNEKGEREKLLEIGFKKDYDILKAKYNNDNILILKTF